MSHGIIMGKTGDDIIQEAINAQAAQIEFDLNRICGQYGLNMDDPDVELDVECGRDTKTGEIGVRYCIKHKGVVIETWGYELDLTQFF